MPEPCILYIPRNRNVLLHMSFFMTRIDHALA